jgi:hypothetical protein
VREIELLDPRDDPDPSAWSAFVRDQGLPAYWAYDLLAIASRDSRSPATLALMRDGDRVCGILCAVVSGLLGTPARYPRLGFVDVRLLGTRNTAWHFADHVDAVARKAFLREFERAVYGRLGPGIRGVLYRAAPARDVPAVAGPARPVKAITADAAMRLTFASVDEWLATLTKSRRADLRRQARLIRDDPSLVARFGFRRDDLDPADLASLLDRHLRRRQRRGWAVPARPLTAEYFAHVLRRDDVGVMSYHDSDGRLLAFGTLFDGGDWPVIGWWAALTPEEGGRKHIYFDHYIRLVAWAIAQGRRGLSAGRGLLAVKRSLGFSAVPMYLVAAPRGLR